MHPGAALPSFALIQRSGERTGRAEALLEDEVARTADLSLRDASDRTFAPAAGSRS